MNPFRPEFEGDLELTRVPEDFSARIRNRVESGFLVPGTRRRANYSVRSTTRDEVTFGAEDFLTAYSIGLNDVRLERRGANVVHYEVKFWRWARTAALHGLVLGLGLAACTALFPAMRLQISSYPFGFYLFAGITFFWCILWPWLLTAIHRRFAEQTLRQVLADILS